jgi:hypothetical protein
MLETNLENLIRPANAATADVLRDQVVPLIDAFRLRQTALGVISDPTDSDRELLTRIRDQVVAAFGDIGRDVQAQAFADDIADWLDRGLDEKPYFDRSRDAFSRVGDGEAALFVGVTRATNSTTPSGVRLELFFIQRHQSRLLVEVESTYPHDHDVHMDVILLAGSEGFTLGNCLVFFPESVAALRPIERQSYAVFFFSKFFDIHRTIAAANAGLLLDDPNRFSSSAGLDEYLCFQVRSLWGYLHDRAHFSGSWSMADNAVLKMHWFIGVIEEIKVDVKLLLMAREGDVPYFDELFSMILLERVFRYPLEPHPERNFDAGTGIFLFSYLQDRGALEIRGGLIGIDQGGAVEALRALVVDIEALERDSLTPDEYRWNATQMVRRYLVESTVAGDKYALTDEQRILRRHVEHFDAVPPLDFSRTPSA